MLLKNALSFSMKMNLKAIVMNCIKTNDWILDILYNEKVDVNDDLACDEGDMLDTQDFDVPTIDAGESLWLLLDGDVRNKWLRSNWCNCSCINERCPRFLTFLRQWWTDVIDGIVEVDLHDVVFWNTWCEMVDSKLVTTESLTLARGKDRGHRRWRWWLWEVGLIVRLLMKRSEVLKSSELICGHDWDGMIPRLSWDIVSLSLLIWTRSWRISFRSPPALIYWVTFYDHNENILVDLCLFLSHLDLDSTTKIDLTMWSIDLFLLILFFLLIVPLTSAFLCSDSDSERNPCPLIVLLTSLIYPFPFCLLDSLNPPLRPCLRCRTDRSPLSLTGMLLLK